MYSIHGISQMRFEDKFEAYVKSKSKNDFARYKFHNKIQQEKESFEQFLTKLKIPVKDCGYADLDDGSRKSHDWLSFPESAREINPGVI